MMGVLTLFSYATRFIVAGANCHRNHWRPPTAHNCPHWLVHLDQLMPCERKPQTPTEGYSAPFVIIRAE